MTNSISQFKNAVTAFHNDEEGANTLEVILILALAAIAGVAIYQFGGRAVAWCKGLLENLGIIAVDHTTGTGNLK